MSATTCVSLQVVRRLEAPSDAFAREGGFTRRLHRVRTGWRRRG